VFVGLAVGAVVGPAGLRLLEPHVLEDSELVESVSQLALLVSLFCVGLRLRVPLEWHCWRMPLRLSTVSFLVLATLAAALAHVLFDVSFSQALLLGAVLGPTDAVLASDIHVPVDGEQDSVPFVLAAEGALTSGLAPPLVAVMLGLGGGAGSGALGSVAGLAVWSIIGGLVIGWLIGVAMARWITLLDSDRQGDMLEEMIVFATAALAYTCALAVRAEGMLAVFAAGLALSHGGRLRRTVVRKYTLGPRVLRFAGRVERFAAIVVMVLLGALVASVELRFRMLVFAVALLALLRPLTARLGLGGLAVATGPRRTLEWFGARGAAALYCLALVINHGLESPFAHEMAAITLVVIVTSIFMSAVSALSLRRASPGALW
jgi:NhaP-type Na+/H+ or K+/H+ antiporter